MENMPGTMQKKAVKRSSSSDSNSSGEANDDRYRSCEEVDSDELDGRLNLSDNEEEAAVFRSKNKA